MSISVSVSDASATVTVDNDTLFITSTVPVVVQITDSNTFDSSVTSSCSSGSDSSCLINSTTVQFTPSGTGYTRAYVPLSGKGNSLSTVNQTTDTSLQSLLVSNGASTSTDCATTSNILVSVLIILLLFYLLTRRRR